jgi:large subunit ribosomal protein L2
LQNQEKKENYNIFYFRFMKILYFPVRSSSGRNNLGRLISFRKGGGLKRKMLFLDFKRKILKIPALIKHIAYNSFRSSFISLLCYKNGYISHVLAAKGLKPGDEVFTANSDFIYTIGDTLPLRFISIGTLIYNIEIYPSSGAQFVRSAGVFAKILKQDLFYTHIRMPSGEERMFSNKCKATIGVVSNETHYLKKFKKAGILRNLGCRPTVRGIAMNPVDHPNGGRTKGGTPFSDR